MFIVLTRRKHHVEKKIIPRPLRLHSHHYSSLHIYNYAFAFFIHFQYSIFSCCFIFVDIRKTSLALTRRDYHISNFSFSNAIPDAGSFLCCDRTADAVTSGVLPYLEYTTILVFCQYLLLKNFTYPKINIIVNILSWLNR